ELEAGVARMALLAEHGQKHEILDADGVARIKPAFAPVRGKIAGAIHDLTDSSGDSRRFAEQMMEVAQRRYARTVALGTRVLGLAASGDLVTGVLTPEGVRTADAYVLAVGVHSP